MRALAFFTLLALPLFAAAQPIDEISVSATGGKSVTTWHGQMGIAALNFEFAHALSPRTDIGLVVSPMTIRQPRSWFGEEFRDGDENVRAFSASLLARRTIYTHYFVEGAMGPMWADKRVPASTSRFNVITQLGAGVTLFSRSAMPLLVGYRFLHISNGGFAPRNPGLNVSSVVIGTQFRLKPRS